MPGAESQTNILTGVGLPQTPGRPDFPLYFNTEEGDAFGLYHWNGTVWVKLSAISNLQAGSAAPLNITSPNNATGATKFQIFIDDDDPDSGSATGDVYLLLMSDDGNTLISQIIFRKNGNIRIGLDNGSGLVISADGSVQIGSAIGNPLILDQTGGVIFQSSVLNFANIRILGSNVRGSGTTLQLPNLAATDLQGGITGTIMVETAVPATATSAGVPGMVAFDGTHVYRCIAANSWVRATMAAW